MKKKLIALTLLTGCGAQLDCVIKKQHTDYAPAPYRSQELCDRTDWKPGDLHAQHLEGTICRSAVPLPDSPTIVCPPK